MRVVAKPKLFLGNYFSGISVCVNIFKRKTKGNIVLDFWHNLFDGIYFEDDFRILCIKSRLANSVSDFWFSYDWGWVYII